MFRLKLTSWSITTSGVIAAAAMAAGQQEVRTMSHALETRQLSKFYGKARGVEEVTFAVPDGQIFGFIGPNGAGKSTTIRTLLGLLTPTSGKAFLLGREVTRDSWDVRSEIGYVPSEINYYDDMKVEDLLAYSASFYRKPTQTRRGELAETFELDLGKRIDSLSLGNKKKVALVQAMQHEPRLLILDEPTSGLDPLIQTRLADVLEQQNRAGVTVFFSSHVLTEVQRLCQTVAIIRDGRLVDVADVKQLQDQQCKRVTLTQPASSGRDMSILQLEGISDIAWAGDDSNVTFLYRGALPALFQALGRETLSDALVEEPSLEEIFLGYYGTGDDHAS